MEQEGIETSANTNTAAVPQPSNIPAIQDTQNKQDAQKKPSKLKPLIEKLDRSPLFMGKRKFITIPALVLALVAVIIVPIIIISSSAPLPLLSEEEYFEW